MLLTVMVTVICHGSTSLLGILLQLLDYILNYGHRLGSLPFAIMRVQRRCIDVVVVGFAPRFHIGLVVKWVNNKITPT